MALQLFEVLGGFSDGNINYLSGTGVAGGDASYQDAAPVGSRYTDVATNTVYTKHTAGAGTTNWEALAKVSDLAGLSATQTWREPVKVLDTVDTTTAAVVTAMNVADTLDGITVVAGDRVLLAGISGGLGPNVYIVGGSTGAWTLTEDVNLETDGDTVSVLQGTHTNEVWMFNTASGGWGLIGQQTASGEEGFIRAFIGKAAAGGELPAYTSSNYVTQGSSLESAIGALDAQSALNAAAASGASSSAAAVQAELDATQAGAGLGVGGAYTAPAGSNYLAASTSILSAVDLLDATLGNTNSNVTAEIANRIAADAAIQAELDAVETGVGLNADGTFAVFTVSNYMNSALSIVGSLSALDAQIAINAADIATEVSARIAAISQEVIDRNAAIAVVDAKVGTASFTGGISAAADLTAAVNLLESNIAADRGRASVVGITNGIVDSVTVDSVEAIKWMISIQDAATGVDKESYEVYASHNGTATADATSADHTKYAKVKSGNGVAGLAFDVVLSGAGAAQNMQLSVAATGSINVKVTRFNV